MYRTLKYHGACYFYGEVNDVVTFDLEDHLVPIQPEAAEV